MPGLSTSQAVTTDDAAIDRGGRTGPFLAVTMLFFFWGFITVMNDVLIPFMKESFDLTYLQAGLVQFAFFGAFFIVSLAYFLFSLLGGDPINRVGYNRAIILALIICAGGCAMFSPAAALVSYPLFLGALFLLATGVTVLQIAANPYAAALGRPENAATRLNLAQGFNSLGTTLAPIAGGLLLYKVFAVGGEVTIDSIKTPYLIYGGMFLALAMVIAACRLPSIDSGPSEETSNALAFPQLRYGMGAIFLYVGSEVAIGSYLVNFMADESVMGWEEGVASLYLAYYWGGAMIGRLCGAVAMAKTQASHLKPIYMAAIAAALLVVIYVVTAVRIAEGAVQLQFAPLVELWPFVVLTTICLAAFALGQGRPGTILTVFSATLVGLLLIAAVSTGRVALWAALGGGLFNSIMWSNIFTLAIDRLGKHTSQGSSLLVMMIVGGAVFPLLMGWVADSTDIRTAFLVPIASYFYIGWYGLWSQRRLNTLEAAE